MKNHGKAGIWHMLAWHTVMDSEGGVQEQAGLADKLGQQDGRVL